jgi:hypothetical protein
MSPRKNGEAEGGGRVLGHEPIPSDRGERLLPATVVASHLEVCAAELAVGAEADAPLGSAQEFAEVVEHLLAGQRSISRALAGLAGRVCAGQANGALATVPALELDVLTEVLQAAANAVGYSADAIAESGPAIESMCESTAQNTRL